MDIDMDRVCRSCLSENSDTYYQINESAECHNNDDSRFDWQNSDLTIADVIMACTAVQIHPCDRLPQAVCMECLHQVQQAFGFKQVCEATDEKLRKYAANVKIENEECENSICEPEAIHVSEISVQELNVNNESDGEIENELIVPDCSNNEPIEITEKIYAMEIGDVPAKDVDETALMAQTQIINGRYQCVLCTKSLGTRKSYRLHLRLHIGKNLKRCNVCERGFARKSHLDRHLLTHRKNVKCNYCTRAFVTEAEQNEHMETCSIRLHLGLNLKKCSHCLQGFSKKSHLDRHLKTHLDKKKHECKLCDVEYQTYQALHAHMYKVHGDESKCTETRKRSFECGMKKVFECDVCQKKFSRLDNLRSHMQRHIPAEQREDVLTKHLCSYCGANFTNSSNLTVHIRRHTGYRPFKCENCDRRFPRSSDLICHRRTHTGERPFACGDCGKAFSRSNQLVRHIRTHTGEKPYKCSHEYCDKSFTQLNDLKLHVRRHSGEKPFVCNCDKRFITNSLLKQHCKSHGHVARSIGHTFENGNHTNIQADQKLIKGDVDMVTQSK